MSTEDPHSIDQSEVQPSAAARSAAHASTGILGTLHLHSHSPFADDGLRTSLRWLAPGDGLLLTGDAVYALLDGAPLWASLEALPASVGLYALDEDLTARAMTQVPERVQALDYPAFVQLCLDYSKVNSWL